MRHFTYQISCAFKTLITFICLFFSAAEHCFTTLLTLECDTRLSQGTTAEPGKLSCGLYPHHLSSTSARGDFHGGWVPRSLHHRERARRVCNGLSHASLRTVFSLQKLHIELNGGGLTNVLLQFPTGPVAFSEIDAQTARHRLVVLLSKHRHSHVCSPNILIYSCSWPFGHRHKEEDLVCSTSALFGICRLQCQTDNHYRSDQIACCPWCLENQLA